MNIMTRSKFLPISLLTLLLTVSLLPGQAMASLIGDTVTAEVLGTPFVQGPVNAIVDNNVEFNFLNGFFSVAIDVTDSGANFFNILPGVVLQDETYRLTSLDWVNMVGQIAGIALDNLGGLSINPVISLLSPNAVEVRLLAGTIVNPNAFVNVSFQTVSGPINSVPEPAALVLLSLGLAGMGFGRRKQVSTHATPILC